MEKRMECSMTKPTPERKVVDVKQAMSGPTDTVSEEAKRLREADRKKKGKP
jgi:hypothetical protein